MATDSETVRLPERGNRSGRLRLQVLGERHSSTHTLPDAGDVVIGRGDDADIQVDDRSISRRHAVLHVRDGVTLEDLGSANGTWVKDRKLAPNESTRLEPGDVVELGGTMLVLQGEGGARPVRGTPRADGADSEAGELTPMARLQRLVDRVAQSAISVLVLGENGAGKDVLARQLHERSTRAGKKFVPINCANFSESLMEAELFGVEDQVATGVKKREGLFEVADGGTLLLDEIGEMPVALQARLLRVLEDRKVRRVGGTREVPVDVRIVSATNRDLEAAVEAGTFRRDLYFRLAGFTLQVPPLRERLDELPGLARRFLDEACARDGRQDRPVFSEQALTLLRSHTWPGNVRELKNVVEGAVLLCAGSTITLEHLPAQRLGPRAGRSAESHPGGLAAVVLAPGEDLGTARTEPSLQDAAALAEERAIRRALEACHQNQTAAAKVLGISRRTLVTKMGQYKIAGPRSKRD